MSNPKDHSPDDADTQLFRDAVADVRPLTEEPRIEAVIKKPSARPRHQLSSNSHEIANIMSDPVDIRDIEIEDVLFYARSGIQSKIQRKLRRGEFAIESELDLHGLNVTEAKLAINQFFAATEKQQQRCIRIIHGKGYRSESNIPVLKTYVAYWLKQRPDVLAYASARPADGGTGALYVLLKVVR